MYDHGPAAGIGSVVLTIIAGIIAGIGALVRFLARTFRG